MSARVEQQKWAVLIMMRENAPGCTRLDRERLDADLFEVSVALGGFSNSISHGTPEERFAALAALVWLGDRRGISPLIRALRDPLWTVRQEALHGLRSFEPLPHWVVSSLDRAARDTEPAVRSQAMHTLACAPHPESLRPLVRALDDRLRGVRLRAARALTDLGDAGLRARAVAHRLLRVIEEDADPWIARAAFRGVRAQGGSIRDARLQAALRWSGHPLWLGYL